ATPSLERSGGRRIRDHARGRSRRSARRAAFAAGELVEDEAVEDLGGEGMGRTNVADAVGIEEQVTELRLFVARADEREAGPTRGEARRGERDDRTLGGMRALRGDRPERFAAELRGW